MGGLGSSEHRREDIGCEERERLDPQTGELLGRYIAEERDSGRRLKVEYERVCASAQTPAAELAELKACVETLQRELANLKRMRSAA